MPRFKHYNQGQTVLLPVSFDRQILPGTFEHTLNYLVDEKLDLNIFHHKYNNETTGRPAYDPALLLKIVLLAYSRGITGSRRIEALCLRTFCSWLYQQTLSHISPPLLISSPPQ